MNDLNKDNIENLINQVGPRIKPDAELKDAVYQEVHKLWLQTHKRSFIRTHAFKIAVSFIIFASFFSITFLIKGEQPNFNIAKNIKIQGQIQISSDNINWNKLSVHKTINPGDFIKTQANNRLYVRLNNGNSFRLDESSTLKINTSDNFSLINGQIYIDSDHANGNHKLSIETQLATIDHIGTRYSISYNEESLNVSVREGLVLVDVSDNKKHQVEKGKQFTQSSSGEYSFNLINSYDDKWLWTQKITPNFEIQDKSMSDYLKWVSSETGYQIQWDSFKVKAKAKDVILSGSINGIVPIDSIDVIFPTTKFSYKLNDSELLIGYNK